jgi:multidrug efflux system membrane fusion protein
VDGRIGLRLVDPGNIVHATDAGGLAVVTQLRPIDVVFTIPEDELPPVLAEVHAGERLEVDAFDRERHQRLAKGTLLTVDNAIDPATGTVRLKAEFPNEDEVLFPNQFVNARLQIAVHRNATLVPEAAVQRGMQGTFAWVVKSDDTVEMRPITLGISESDHVAITTGVSDGERIVVEGAEGLRAGDRVTVTPRRAAGAPDKREAS